MTSASVFSMGPAERQKGGGGGGVRRGGATFGSSRGSQDNNETLGTAK